jgi:hypothetical protein
MSLKSKYSKEVRKELSLFPIWIPGAQAEPGDIGTGSGSSLEASGWPTFPANLCSLSRVPISRGSMTHALYPTFPFRAQAQSNSM